MQICKCSLDVQTIAIFFWILTTYSWSESINIKMRLILQYLTTFYQTVSDEFDSVIHNSINLSWLWKHFDQSKKPSWCWGWIFDYGQLIIEIGSIFNLRRCFWTYLASFRTRDLKLVCWGANNIFPLRCSWVGIWTEMSSSLKTCC